MIIKMIMLLKFALLLHSYFTLDAYREPVYPVPFLRNQITERGKGGYIIMLDIL